MDAKQNPNKNLGVWANREKILSIVLVGILLAGCSSSGNFTPRVGFIVEAQEKIPDDLAAAEDIAVALGFQRVPSERENKVYSQPLISARWLGFYKSVENPNLQLSMQRILGNSFKGPDYSSNPNALELQVGEYCGWCNIGCFSESGRSKILQTYKLLVREFEPEAVKIWSNCMDRSERDAFFQIN